MSDMPVPFVYATDMCGAEAKDGRYACELGSGHQGAHRDGEYTWNDAGPIEESS